MTNFDKRLTPVSLKTYDGLAIVGASFLGQKLPKLAQVKVIGKIMETYCKSPIDAKADRVDAILIRVDEGKPKNRRYYNYRVTIYYTNNAGEVQHAGFEGTITVQQATA